MKRPFQRGAVPIGGYCRYVDPDAGFVIKHPYYEMCKSKAQSERTTRGLPIPYDWDSFFDEQFCKATPQACIDIPDAPIEKGPEWKEMASHFWDSMVRWVAYGMPITTWEEYKRRHTICAGDETTPRCPKFTKFAGTGIAKCGKCGCSSLKLFLQTEHCPLKKW